MRSGNTFDSMSLAGCGRVDEEIRIVIPDCAMRFMAQQVPLYIHMAQDSRAMSLRIHKLHALRVGRVGPAKDLLPQHEGPRNAGNRLKELRMQERRMKEIR